jgi:hypothetical protein
VARPRCAVAAATATAPATASEAPATTHGSNENLGIPKPIHAHTRETIRPENVHRNATGSEVKSSGRWAVVRVRLSVVGAGSPSRTQLSIHHHAPSTVATRPASASPFALSRRRPVVHAPTA